MGNITYLAISDDNPGALYRAQQALNSFATSQGWPNGIKHSSNLKEGVPGGPVFQTVVRTLSSDDTLAVPALSHLGSLPSDIEKNVLAIVASGAALYVLDIGRVENSLVAIRATLAASKEIERQYLSTRQHVDLMAEKHAQELEEYGAAIVARMATKFGTRQLFATLDKEDAQENATAKYIRERRTELGLSQDKLAKLVNTTGTTIGRIEQGQGSEYIGAILKALSNPQHAGA